MAREINAELLDTKIEKAQQDLVKAKHRYDAAAATLKDLLDKGQIPVSFDGLHTWASLYNGRLSVKAEASNIRKVGMK